MLTISGMYLSRWFQMVMKFHNFDIFYMSSALACRVDVTIKRQKVPSSIVHGWKGNLISFQMHFSQYNSIVIGQSLKFIRNELGRCIIVMINAQRLPWPTILIYNISITFDSDSEMTRTWLYVFESQENLIFNDKLLKYNTSYHYL